MKISIVYHSSTGRTEAAAKEIVKGIEAVEGMEAVLIPVSSFSEKKDEYVKELQESAGVLFGTPDYYAAESWQLKQWLDTCPVSLGGKLGGAFATSNVPQGGPVMAIESIPDPAPGKGNAGLLRRDQPWKAQYPSGACMYRAGDDRNGSLPRIWTALRLQSSRALQVSSVRKKPACGVLRL